MPPQLRVKVLSDQPKRHSSILFTALINESSKESQALSKLIPISEDHNKSVLIMNISALPEDKPWFSSEDWPPWGSSPVLRTSLSSRRQPLGHGLSTLLTTISGLKERNTSSCPSSLDSTGNYSIWRWPTSRPTGPRTPKPESEISWELHENKSSTSQSILTILTSETTLFLTYIPAYLVLDQRTNCSEEPYSLTSWVSPQGGWDYGEYQSKQDHLRSHAGDTAKYRSSL